MVTRYTLGDHPLARSIAAEGLARRALTALTDLEGVLGRDLHPTLQDLVRTTRRQVETISRRAAALREDHEAREGRVQGGLL